jgi:hypothetical protein
VLRPTDGKLVDLRVAGPTPTKTLEGRAAGGLDRQRGALPFSDRLCAASSRHAAIALLSALTVATFC